jgi:hypothetical protein
LFRVHWSWLAVLEARRHALGAETNAIATVAAVGRSSSPWIVAAIDTPPLVLAKVLVAHPIAAARLRGGYRDLGLRIRRGRRFRRSLFAAAAKSHDDTG